MILFFFFSVFLLSHVALCCPQSNLDANEGYNGLNSLGRCETRICCKIVYARCVLFRFCSKIVRDERSIKQHGDRIFEQPLGCSEYLLDFMTSVANKPVLLCLLCSFMYFSHGSINRAEESVQLFSSYSHRNRRLLLGLRTISSSLLGAGLHGGCHGITSQPVGVH